MTAESPRVLIVGTYGGGGVHQYVEEQHRRLSDRLSVSSYDMRMPPAGSGATWFVYSVLLGLWAAILFPFRRRPDIVHVHTSHRFSFYRSSLYVLFAAYVWNRPVVVHVHGSSFDEFVATDSRALAWYQSVVFDASDRVVVLSPHWRDVVATRTDEESIHVLPNAVEPSSYDPEFGADPPRLVFVSNMIDRKGVAELVEAVDRLATSTDRPFEAEFAGKGPLSSSVEELAAEHENVTYHGYVSEQRKRELLSEGSIYVLPTYAEGLPIAMLEGMAGGNAVVSTTVGSIPEVIGDENGILIEPGDVDELHDALETLVTSPERVEGMGRQNRRQIEQRYSWEEITDELLEIYGREVPALEGRGAGSSSDVVV
ncbi:glycosyltransferase family 4 protein [Natrialba swarupiae]|uniref:Glycosyltransferase family 4 protein n=1 Tax=Natrialba swarupiae TaxID=2448032 RepID=A0A5D5AUF9_9EURY|nr:glycosyltransferase family 4 protein [Natrialba swarupiae]TYT63482.1 glycosyltransferase family 4 protein [Natrialba swarupiae]